MLSKEVAMFDIDCNLSCACDGPLVDAAQEDAAGAGGRGVEDRCDTGAAELPAPGGPSR